MALPPAKLVNGLKEPPPNFPAPTAQHIQKSGPVPFQRPPTAALPRTGVWQVETGKKQGGQRIVLYGPGGIGKTTLASLAPRPLFFDCEAGSRELDLPRVKGITNFEGLRAALQSSVCDDYETLVIDTATKAEEFACALTFKTIRNDNGETVSNIEGYGWGKGYQHVYATFLLLMHDCDLLVHQGKNVILVAHDCINDVPNPAGENYIRYEPHLQSPRSGKGSIRNRVIQWADYVLFMGYDVNAMKGKGRGSGTRTIWSSERPDHVAKARKAIDPLPFISETDATLWTNIFGGGR